MATCPYCGKAFDPYAHDWRRRRATTTCGSPECRRARDADYKRHSRERKRAQEVHAIRKCVICGASFKPLNSRHICCSEACSARRNVLKERERFAARPAPIRPRADTKAQKLERDLLQVRRDMALQAAERYQAQKSWTKDQRNYARRLYESRHGLFRGAGKMCE